MIGYGKYFDSNKAMSFKRLNELNEHIKIWGKISSSIGKEVGSGPVYGDSDKYIKIKIKSYEYKVNTNLQDRKLPKENTSQKRLSLIMLDSVIRVNKKYYPQTLLERCKYETKKNKMENFIGDDLVTSSSDNESDNESDSKSDNESDNESDNGSNDSVTKNKDCILKLWI